MSNGRYFALDRDGVFEFKVTDLADMPVEAFIDRLIETRNEGEDTSLVKSRKIINSPFPLYSWANAGGVWEMAVKVPETRIKYRSNIMGDHIIYLPPVLYTVKGDDNGRFIDSHINVIKQDSILAKNIKLGHLSLPNISPHILPSSNDRPGRICVGTTSIIDSTDEALDPSQILVRSWDLLINSNWNTDYLGSLKFPTNIAEVGKKHEITVPKEYGGELYNLKLLLMLLQTRGMHEELDWVDIDG